MMFEGWPLILSRPRNISVFVAVEPFCPALACGAAKALVASPPNDCATSNVVRNAADHCLNQDLSRALAVPIIPAVAKRTDQDPFAQPALGPLSCGNCCHWQNRTYLHLPVLTETKISAIAHNAKNVLTLVPRRRQMSIRQARKCELDTFRIIFEVEKSRWLSARPLTFTKKPNLR